MIAASAQMRPDMAAPRNEPAILREVDTDAEA
jgi:hypothetical protein